MFTKIFRIGFSFIFTFLLFACGPAPATEPPPSPVPSETPLPPTATPIPPTPTLTPTPTRTSIPSPTPDLKATEQYSSMESKVQEYSKLGYLSRTEGEYRSLKPFSNEWAQMDWYRWEPIEISISKDYIIRTDVTWSSASTTPNESGCGFVFRLQPNNDHYVVVMGVNGYIFAAHNLASRWVNMGAARYGKSALNGKANLTLIVEHNVFKVLVDDKLVKEFTGFDGKLSSGDLGYTILSGTNKDFGTRCRFENTQLWRLKNE